MTDPNSALTTTQSPGMSVYADGDSFMTAQRMAQSLAASTIVPPEYRGQAGLGNCLVALETAWRLGVSPLAVFQNMQIVHGKPVWSSAFLIGLVNTCGRYSPLQFIYDNPEQPTACYAVARDLVTGADLRGTTITMQMAQSEGWLNRSGSKWKTMPAQMLAYRAASFWVRMYAPDLTLGIRAADEVIDAQEVEPATVKVESQLMASARARVAELADPETAAKARAWVSTMLDSKQLTAEEATELLAAIDAKVPA